MERNKLKKKIKIIIDILMYSDFLFLMNQGVIQNLHAHGISGMILFGLFILHHVLNGWFYKSAFSGYGNAGRFVLNVTDWILFVLMILMALSSVGMSGMVFEWAPVRASQTWRTLHLMSTSWGFMVMSLHLGLHVRKALKKLRSRFSDSLVKKFLYYFVSVLISVCGIWCFMKTQLYVYMFNTGGWKLAASSVTAGILEYIGITAGICAAAGGSFFNKKKRFR